MDGSFCGKAVHHQYKITEDHISFQSDHEFMDRLQFSNLRLYIGRLLFLLKHLVMTISSIYIQYT